MLENEIKPKDALLYLLSRTCSDLRLWIERQQSLGASNCPRVESTIPNLGSTQRQETPAAPLGTRAEKRAPEALEKRGSPDITHEQKRESRETRSLAGFRKLRTETNIFLDKRAFDLRKKSLGELSAACTKCEKCQLSRGRERVIFGAGKVGAPLFCLGSGLDPNELKEERIFAAESGDLFDNMIGAMKLGRNEIYITNAIKCAHSKRLKAEATHYYACQEYLLQEISLIAPKVIIVWGEAAFKALFRDNTQSIVQLRGKWFDFHSIAVMPTFHPAYIVRKPEVKRLVWADLKAVMKKLGIE